MDPIGFVVICLSVWGILQRTPGLVGDAAREVSAGLRGGTTGAAEAVRQRLIDAGVDPADQGGRLRRFTGNVWRDYWHDKDRDRQQKRADAKVEQGLSWWRRHLDDAIDRQASKYRGTPGPSPDGGPGTAGPETGPEPVATSQPDPSAEPGGADEPASPGAAHDSDEYREGPRSEQQPSTEPDRPRPPIRVTATVGGPVTSDAPAQNVRTETAVLDRPIPAQIEGNPDMGSAVATNGTAVTGVVSGSYEMLSIHRHLESATAEFVAQLAMIQKRLNRAGESTIGTVQFASGSTVVGRMAQAVEAVAALRAAAATCTAEVSPLLLQTKAEFDKRNS